MTGARADWRFVEAPESQSGPDGLDIGGLRDAARSEGFVFLDRLLAEWSNGANRFDGAGERLVAVRRGRRVAGIGGLNRDAWAGPRTGRLRRLYVAPDQRRRGMGLALVARLLAQAPAAFDRVRLRTGDPGAARFYERLGFAPSDEADASHVPALGRGAASRFEPAGGPRP